MGLLGRWTALATIMAFLSQISARQAPHASPAPPPPSPQPSGIGTALGIAYATSASTPDDPKGTSKAPGAVRLMVGQPKRGVTAATTCQPAPKLAWSPSLQVPRCVDLRYDGYYGGSPDYPGYTGAEVKYLMPWLLNVGSLDPPVASVQLLMRPKGARGSAQDTLVTVYTGAPGQRRELECPGQNSLPLAWTPGTGMPLAVYNNLTVVGVRIHVNNGTVKRSADLPSIASVALVLET